MGENEEIHYYRIPRGIVDSNLDFLVADKISLQGKKFVEQRRRIDKAEGFILTPYQYFSIRNYASLRNKELKEVLHQNKGLERLNQIIQIDLGDGDCYFYNAPEINHSAESEDFIFDEGIRHKPSAFHHENSMFGFENLDKRTGFPIDFMRDPANDGKEMYSLIIMGQRTYERDFGKSRVVFITPVFRNLSKKTRSRLEIMRSINGYGDLGIRKCYLANDANLNKFDGKIVEEKTSV